MSEKPAKQRGPRQRHKRLLDMGLGPCAKCGKVLPVSEMAMKGPGVVSSYCRPCHAARQRAYQQEAKKTSPNGAPLLSAPVLCAPVGGADYDKAVAFAREAMKLFRGRAR